VLSNTSSRLDFHAWRRYELERPTWQSIRQPDHPSSLSEGWILLVEDVQEGHRGKQW